MLRLLTPPHEGSFSSPARRVNVQRRLVPGNNFQEHASAFRTRSPPRAATQSGPESTIDVSSSPGPLSGRETRVELLGAAENEEAKEDDSSSDDDDFSLDSARSRPAAGRHSPRPAASTPAAAAAPSVSPAAASASAARVLPPSIAPAPAPMNAGGLTTIDEHDVVEVDDEEAIDLTGGKVYGGGGVHNLCRLHKIHTNSTL